MNYKNQATLQMFDAQTFFSGIFIGSYVCALHPVTGAQTHGVIPVFELERGRYSSYDELFEKHFFPLNRMGFGVHFTPNGCQTADLHNREENITHVNAWFADVDIEETKTIVGDRRAEMEMIRDKKKAEILELIFNKDLRPSLTVETRNGFQLYWFAKTATLEGFRAIQQAIFKELEGVGADKGAMRVNSLLRVPYMRYKKRGESGMITPMPAFSSMELWTEEEMRRKFQVKERQVIENPALKAMFSPSPVELRHKAGGNDKIAQILRVPIQTFLEKLSGRSEVNGDIFSFAPVRHGKTNILANNQPTPNWVDIDKNLLFSNNQKGMANIIHYVCYYGLTKKEAIELLHAII